MDRDAWLDWCYSMVVAVMLEYGYPSDPDGEERDEPQEIPLLKAA